MTGVLTTCVEVIFRVIGSGLCSPEKDNLCAWKSSSESILVTTNKSPSQDYTNPDDQPTTNLNTDSPGFRPFAVLGTNVWPQ